MKFCWSEKYISYTVVLSCQLYIVQQESLENRQILLYKIDPALVNILFVHVVKFGKPYTIHQFTPYYLVRNFIFWLWDGAH